MKRSFMMIHVALASAAVLLFADSALAAKVRVSVEKFSGPISPKVQAAVKSALKARKEVQLVSSNADAVISGSTRKVGKVIEAKLTVSTEGGERLGGAGWKIKNGQTRALEKSLWATLGKAIKKGPAAEEREEEAPAVASRKSKVVDVPQADDESSEKAEVAEVETRKVVKHEEEREEEREETARASSSDSSESDSNEVVASRDDDDHGGSSVGDVDADVGIHAFTRSFSYNQPLAGQLASYHLTSGPAAAVNLTWFVGGLADDESAVRNLGVGVSAESAFGIGSGAQDGSRVGTSAYAFDLGAKYRIPFGMNRVVVGAGYGQRSFAIAETPDVVLSMVPDISYKFLSARVGGRLQFNEQLSLNLSAAYLHLLSTGELSTDKFFPRATGAGVEASAFVGYEFTSKWEARVGVDMQRFFFSLHPEPGDANVAGGALDQFFAGTARIAYRID